MTRVPFSFAACILFPLSSISLLMGGCTTISSALGLRAKRFNESPVVQNPALNGKVDNLPVSDGNGGTYRMASATGGALCIHVTREVSVTRAALLEFRLSGFNSPEQTDDEVPSATPTTQRVVTSDLKNYTYQASEQDTVKDSHGRTIAHIDRPVTRVAQYNETTIEACFPMTKTVTKNSKYVVLTTKPEGLLSFGDVQAIWRLR